MYNTDFKHLEFLAETGWGRSHLKEFLLNPDSGLWRSSSPQTCSEFYSRLKRRFGDNPRLIHLLDLHLLAEALVHKDRAAEWFVPWVREHIRMDRYLPGISRSMALCGHWRAVPVFLVNEQVYLRYFIIGLVTAPHGIPPWPGWAERLMDESAKRGIIRAEKACNHLHPAKENQRFICYPLTIPNEMIQFRHDSLGLPMALGCMTLLTGEALSGEPAASGSVLADGSVQAVGRLSGKMIHARNMGFRVFFFPAYNHGSPGIGHMECVPVGNLRQAWMFAKLHTPGRAPELLLLENMLNDPVIFINNCNTLPIKWLEWARNNGLDRKIKASLSTSPSLFDIFVKNLDACLDKGDLVRGEALSKWVDSSSVARFMDTGSGSLFKWFSLNLSMANHRGDVQAAHVWRKKADLMVEKASVRDTESFAAFCNHRFICRHHNRYDFDPERLRMIKTVLNALEGQYRSQCRLTPNAVNVTLGALYGSIAQHYGFCGPEYLPQTRKYCRLSGKAYGDGKVPGLKAHWRRSFNYLFHAFLDAGCPDEAEATLLTYLEMDDWGELQHAISGLSEWHHAALARFFAAGKGRGKVTEYVKWALENRDRLVEKRHPWQLWLNNMGRVSLNSGDGKNAREFFKRSLRLCLSGRLGHTVRVMGLLPLSGLRRISTVEGLEIDSVEKRIRASAENLNPNHFRPFLKQPDLTRFLDILWRGPEALFPFTYR